MNTLFPLTRQQFFDNTGAPLSGGLVYTYAAGTTTPVATYTASGATNTNPVVLDFRGSCDLWGVTTQGYKILVQDKDGNTLPGYPVDDIQLPPFTTSGSFTITGGGFSGTAPSATAQWQVTGLVATVFLPTISAPSNATNFSLSGFPSNLTTITTTQQCPIAVAEDNSTVLWSGVSVIAAPTSTWIVTKSGPWTASGDKGFDAQSITYLLI